MRSTKLISSIISDARYLARALDFNKPSPSSMLFKYNIALAKIYKLLNGAKNKMFMACSPIGYSPGLVALSTENQYYVASIKTISGSFDDTYEGAGIMYSNGTTVYFDTLDSISADHQTAVLTNGSTSDIVAGSLSYIIFPYPTWTNNLISIDGMGVDEISRIWFPTTGDGKFVNEDEIESVGSDSGLVNTCAVCLTGSSSVNKLHLEVGSDVVNYGGFPILFFSERPRWATATTEYVDLPTEFHSTLVKEIARMVMVEDLKRKAPPMLENALVSLDTIGQSYEATKQAFEQNMDVPR